MVSKVYEMITGKKEKFIFKDKKAMEVFEITFYKDKYLGIFSNNIPAPIKKEYINYDFVKNEIKKLATNKYSNGDICKLDVYRADLAISLKWINPTLSISDVVICLKELYKEREKDGLYEKENR